MDDFNCIIKITLNAKKDLDSIYNYISKNLYANKAADNLLNKIESSIINLKTYPYMGSLVPDKILKHKYHKLTVKNYNIFYIIEIPNVIIMRVLYGGSDYIKNLQKELDERG